MSESQLSFALVVGSTGVLLLTAYICYRYASQRNNKNRTIKINDDLMPNFSHLELRRRDKNDFPFIRTLTWFEGDHEAAAHVLKSRVQQVIELNPWLTGRLVRHAGGIVHLSFDASTTALRNVGQEIMDNKSDYFLHLDKMPDDNFGVYYGMSLMQSYHSSEANNLVLVNGSDYRGPLFKIVIAPCAKAPHTRFGIFCSLSHSAADGNTFHSILNMILGGTDPKAKLKALNPKRVDIKGELPGKILGETEAKLVQSPGFLFSMIRRLFCLRGKVLSYFFPRQYDVVSRIYVVDKKKIMALKNKETQQNNDVPFVSTNDIITSWFITASSCNVGLMAMDLRNRIQSYKEDLAGNFNEELLLRNEDAETPSLIRKSLDARKRFRTSDRQFTGLEFSGSTWGIATNWASFASKSYDLGPDVKKLLHFPLFGFDNQLLTTIDLCVPFQVTHDTMIVLVACLAFRARYFDAKEAPFAASPTDAYQFSFLSP